jgi:hypothetical protein
MAAGADSNLASGGEGSQQHERLPHTSSDGDAGLICPTLEDGFGPTTPLGSTLDRRNGLQ